MNVESFMKEQRRLRDRARRSGMKARLMEIGLQAQMLCDSHTTEAQQQEVLNRMLKSLISALKAYKLDEDQRQLLTEIFKDSGIDIPHVSRNGNSLRLEGNFDIRELAKRMIWQGVFEESVRGVGEDSEDDIA